MKKFIAMAMAAVIVSCIPVQATPKTTTYPGLLRVTATEKEVVVGVDANGFEWEFAEVGHDYEAGDLCAVIYDDKGTEIIFDDEIVAHRYVGTTEMYK